MDADISGALTALDLAKIKAQEFRNSRTAMLAVANTLSDWIKSQYADIKDPDPAVEFRRAMAIAIAANYMKPSTGTIDATILADAVNDARRFKVALDEACKVV